MDAECPCFMGNRLAVFAVVVLLSLQVQGGYTVQNYADGTRNLGDAVFTFGERTNSPNSDAKSVWHDCSNASAAGACDDPIRSFWAATTTMTVETVRVFITR